jgi:nucleotide-binding universal stress UspA family protein
MNTKTILFPTDFSTLADSALEYATALARSMNAKILIVHVEDPISMYGGGEVYFAVPEPDDTALRNMLAELKPSDPRVPCEHILVKGSPAAEIVRLAEENEAEMIVMGTHGRSGFGRVLMGSVAETVVRRASCPVLTVKSPRIPQNISD